MGEIIVLENELVKTEINPKDVFVAGGLDFIIGQISDKAKTEAEGLDPATDKGRKAFGSVCRKVSSSKTFIESAMKKFVADLKEQIKPVDAERIRFCTEMDRIRDEIDAPRKEWQAAEEAKIAAANAVMKELNDAAIVYADTTADDLAKRILKVESTDIDNLPEDYRENAENIRNDVLSKLYPQLIEVQRREVEAAELAKLRAEAAAREEADRKAKEERDRIEREEQIKAEAAAKATREAEEKAAQAKNEADEAIAKAKRDAEAAENRRIAEAEAARVAQENAVKEAERKAKEEAEKLERDRLAELEQQRIAEEKKAANKKHREKIKKESCQFIMGINGTTQEQAEWIFDAIAFGSVPHIKIEW